MKRCSHLFTILTLSILCLGMTSILLSTDGYRIQSALFVIAAAIVDAVDGSIARRFRSESHFGECLDSYVDVIVFGVAPAILLYQSMGKHDLFLGGALAMAITCFAVIRFARGTKLEGQREKHCFRGLPIPVTGMWIALFVLMVEENAIPGLDNTFQGAKILWGFMAVCTVLFLFLQISNVPYTKPGKKPLIVVITIAAIVMLFSGYIPLTLWSTFCICSVLYVAVNPFQTRLSMPTNETAPEQPISFSH